MSQAGLDEDEDILHPDQLLDADQFGSASTSLHFASAVIGMFEATSNVIALAILMPVVASMGGIAHNRNPRDVELGQRVGHAIVKA